ncbi:putative YLP motif-containing protein 1 [Hypsibius exemplaris]|uniref:YLP motif-containing protein 1 n=1 Tax=Hypsibius exemplaris TaxID=2072580 RepID=A0A1W0WL84_HYPEX|nr:putative YLP motif-containing protein 1 [Hypsibius exemplaris]
MRGIQPFPPQRFPPRHPPQYGDSSGAAMRPPYGQPNFPPGQFQPQHPQMRPPNPNFGPPRQARPPFFQPQPQPPQRVLFSGPPQQPRFPDPSQQYQPYPDYSNPSEAGAYGNGHSAAPQQQQCLPQGALQQPQYGAGLPQYQAQPPPNSGFGGGPPPNGSFSGGQQFGQSMGAPNGAPDGSMASQSGIAEAQASQGNQMQALFEAVSTAEHEEQFEAYLNKWEAYYTAYREQCRSTYDPSSFEAHNTQFQSYLDYLTQYRTALAQRKAVRIAAEAAAALPPPPPPPSTAAASPSAPVRAAKPEPQFLRAPPPAPNTGGQLPGSVRPAQFAILEQSQLRGQAPSNTRQQVPVSNQSGYQPNLSGLSTTQHYTGQAQSGTTEPHRLYNQAMPRFPQPQQGNNFAGAPQQNLPARPMGGLLQNPTFPHPPLRFPPPAQDKQNQQTKPQESVSQIKPNLDAPGPTSWQAPAPSVLNRTADGAATNRSRPGASGNSNSRNFSADGAAANRDFSSDDYALDMDQDNDMNGWEEDASAAYGNPKRESKPSRPEPPSKPQMETRNGGRMDNSGEDRLYEELKKLKEFLPPPRRPSPIYNPHQPGGRQQRDSRFEHDSRDSERDYHQRGNGQQQQRGIMDDERRYQRTLGSDPAMDIRDHLNRNRPINPQDDYRGGHNRDPSILGNFASPIQAISTVVGGGYGGHSSTAPLAMRAPQPTMQAPVLAAVQMLTPQQQQMQQEGLYDNRFRTQGPATESYREPMYPARVQVPLQSAPPSNQQPHLSADIVSRVGPARRMMEALSQNRPIQTNELLSIISSVKTDTLVNNQPAPQPANAPSVTSELAGLLRQIQALVGPALAATVAAPSQQQQVPPPRPEPVGQPIQRLSSLSQLPRPSPVDAMAPPMKPLFRGVPIPPTQPDAVEVAAAALRAQLRGDTRPAQTDARLSRFDEPSLPVPEPKQRNLVSIRQLPDAPAPKPYGTYQSAPASSTPVNGAVMTELGMSEPQVIEAMERVRALVGNMLSQDQAAQLMAMMRSTITGGSLPVGGPPQPAFTQQQLPQPPQQYHQGLLPNPQFSESYRQRSPSPPYSSRSPERGGHTDRRYDRGGSRYLARQSRSPVERRRSRSLSREREQRDRPPSSASHTSGGDRRIPSAAQGFFAKALQHRNLGLGVGGVPGPGVGGVHLQGPLVPPGFGRPPRAPDRSTDRPSQQGQGAELRASITPLDELVPRAVKTKKLAFLLRGPPGSGKSWVARKIKELEPDTRILSMDDYFEVETDVDHVDSKGRHTSKKGTVYQYEEKQEAKYRQELEKLFRKKTEDSYCSCLVVDACNERLAYFMDMVMFGTRNGFEVFIGEMPGMKPYELERKSTHFRSASDIAEIVRNWEPTPSSLFRVDLKKLVAEMPVWNPERSQDLPERICMKFSGWKVPSKSKWEVDDEDDKDVETTSKGTSWVEKDSTDTKKRMSVDWVEKPAPTPCPDKKSAEKPDNGTGASTSKERNYRSRSRSPNSPAKKKR